MNVRIQDRGQTRRCWQGDSTERAGCRCRDQVKRTRTILRELLLIEQTWRRGDGTDHKRASPVSHQHTVSAQPDRGHQLDPWHVIGWQATSDCCWSTRNRQPPPAISLGGLQGFPVAELALLIAGFTMAESSLSVNQSRSPPTQRHSPSSLPTPRHRVNSSSGGSLADPSSPWVFNSGPKTCASAIPSCLWISPFYSPSLVCSFRLSVTRAADRALSV